MATNKQPKPLLTRRQRKALEQAAPRYTDPTQAPPPKAPPKERAGQRNLPLQWTWYDDLGWVWCIAPSTLDYIMSKPGGRQTWNAMLDGVMQAGDAA